MNLDELRSVQSKERSKDSLQHLRESFYSDVGEYIRGLREERERAAERASDPFDSDEVNRLTDEIQTAEEVVEAVYERRVGKVVKRASLAAAGIPADEEGLTSEEQVLFSDLVGRIESNKTTVLDVLSGEGSASTEPSTTESGTQTQNQRASPVDSEPTSESDPESASDDRPNAEAAAITGDDESGESEPASPAPSAREPEPTATEADGSATVAPDSADARPDNPSNAPETSASEPESRSEPEPAEESEPDLSDDRTMVRITQDVGSILGVDEREYDLSSEDVVALPTQNAGPLIERDAAEKLD
ncbi:hypothetical protein NKF26_05935 [Haladaptatus sp. AB618]|uniref:DNA replication complex subunit Gins51 n=1 Tax=Haladaptatus sp. AB618 TaxID=2934173 RepID=UPI00209BC6F6|nr:hypothetical protein [Haladaptatus sp. AB618]MCO8253345.1 hypothetical protein [Haladaptatus sp. AB618]